jgi:hypothetical protein
MNRHALSTLALAVLAAALCSAPAAAQSALQRCDKPMADADHLAQTLAECSAALEAARSSLSTVASSSTGPEEKLVTTTSSLTVDLTRAAMTAPLHGRLVAYYTYAAYGAGDPAQCSPLSHIGKGPEGRCRQGVADLGFVRARYGSAAELNAACRQTDSESGAGAAACCSLIAESRNRPDPCATMAPKCIDAVTCRAIFGSWAGEAGSCRSLPMPQEGDCKGDECHRLREERVSNCEADALFARAFKAKNIGECGGSERCRVLMGAGKTVSREISTKDLRNPVGAWFLRSGWTTPLVVGRTREPLKPLPPAAAAAVKKLDFNGFVCAEPLSSLGNRQAITAVLNTAHTCLSDVETASARPSRALTEAIDEREEKLIRLGLRLNKYFEGGKPAKASAPAPK